VSINLALNALTFFNLSSTREFCKLGGIDPFTSIHSIHMFVHWLSSLPVRQVLSSDLLLVGWAVKGFPIGLRTFLQFSLGWEKLPQEKITLEYLLWHLEMWRSVFSSTIVVEYARQRGKIPSMDVAEWYANAISKDRMKAQEAARGYWDCFSGKNGMYSCRSSHLT
jgi:hypothetical protein